MTTRKTRKYYKRQKEQLDKLYAKTKEVVLIYQPVNLPIKKKEYTNETPTK